MRIVWDEPKRRLNESKHRLDFASLTPDFFERAAIRSVHSNRLQGIGMLEGQVLISVVFRRLGEQAVSVISMRPASAEERRLHERHEGLRSD